MKLHLPKGIRSALLACICGAVAVGQSAFAHSFTESTTVDSISISSDTTINVAEDVTVTTGKIDDSETTYTKTGAGTLIVTGAPTVARPLNAVVEEGTLVIQYLTSWEGGFVGDDATVKAGATLKFAHDNVLGANSQYDIGCDNVILTGEDGKVATLEVANSTRLNKNLVLNGNTVVSGEGGIVTYGQNSAIIVTGTSNNVSTAVTVSDGPLAISGTGTVDFTGALTLNNELSIASGATVISSGTLTLGENFSMALGEGTLGDDNRYTFTTGLTVTGSFNKGSAHGAWEVVNNQLVLVAANHTYSSDTLAWSEGGTINDTIFASGDLVTFVGSTEATLGSDVFSSVVTVEGGASLNVITNGYSFATSKLVLAGSLKLDSYAAISGLHSVEAADSANITLNVGVGTDKTLYNKLDDFCNAYTGDVVLQNGRYSLHNDNGGAFSHVTVEDGAQFAINRMDYTGDITITGVGVEEGNDDLGGALKLFNGRKISGKVTVAEAGASILVWGSDAGTLAGTLQLDGELAKTSGGTLNLTGTIAGTGALNVKGGTVVINTESDNTLAALKGSGTLKKSSASTLTITDATSFSGNLNVEKGTVSLASGMTAEKITLGGTLELTSTGAVSATTWEGTEEGTGLVKLNFADNVKISSVLSGYTGAVEVANGSVDIDSSSPVYASITGNGGRIGLSDNVTYTGDIILKGNGTGGYVGDLVMGSNSKIGGQLTVAAGNGVNLEIWETNTATLAGKVLLEGNATVGAQWKGTLNVTGEVSGTAALNVNGGTLNLSGTVADTVAVNVNDGTLAVAAGSIGSSKVNVNGGTLSFSEAFELTQGKVTLKGGKLSTSAITVNGGELELAGGGFNLTGSETNKVTLTSGTLSASKSETVGHINVAGGTVSTSNDATLTLNDVSFTGVLTNNGKLTLGGTLTVDSLDSLTADTTATKADTYSAGDNGYVVSLNKAYTLVSGGEGSSLTLNTDKVTVGESTYTVEANGGSATVFDYTTDKSTYHVNSGTVAYTDAAADTTTTSINLAGGTLTIADGTTADAAIKGTGTVTTNGAVNLGNAEGFTGTLKVESGTTALAGGTYTAEITGSGTVAAAGAVVLQNAGIGTGVAYSVPSATRAASSISFDDADGTRGLTVTSGSVAADGTTTDATINVAAGATLGANNNLTLGTGSTLVLAADATGTGALTLGEGATITFNGGTLDLTALNISTSQVGTTTLFNGGTVTGLKMENITGVTASEGFTVTVDDNGNLVVKEDTPVVTPTEPTLATITTASTTYDSTSQVLTFTTDLDVTELTGDVQLSYDNKTYNLSAIMGADFALASGVGVSLLNKDGQSITFTEGMSSLTINGYDGFTGTLADDDATSAVRVSDSVYGQFYAPSIPEPATATLSLLALAALAARRRRG